MQQAIITNDKIASLYDTFGKARMSFVTQAGIGYGKWKLAYKPRTCRAYGFNYASGNTYAQPPWFASHTLTEMTNQNRPKKLGKAFVYWSADVKHNNYTPTKIEQRLIQLHAWEKQAGVSLTKVVQISSGTWPGYVFIGDKAWMSNLWKVTLYTYLLKKVIFRATEYDTLLTKDRLDKFLSKVNTCFEEKLVCDTNKNIINTSIYESINVYSGFATICESDNKALKKETQQNPYMRNLLLGDK